ncbi:multicopper oxidase family protein [Actinoplanes solisilvae]|uniref:multicopper oxidase family protein n=1 Tax=Actinoplanes solisilvae TaxID=2486853 RepID=UPI000FDB3CC1|nr:multicopper oxidase family protein [Actinoplanes solisilvae]
MTTGSWLVADLLAGLLATAGWLGAGATSIIGRRRLTAGLALLALLATVTRVVTVVALTRAGWWFAAEKVLIAGPLTLAALVGLVLRRRVAFLFAGYATGAGLLVTVLDGYPVSAGVGLLAVAGVAAASAITLRGPAPRSSRAAAVTAIAALVVGTGLAAAPGAPPAVHHDHAVAAPGVGEPTKRFTLTAAAGADGVWAFNGQVPGPEINALVGDVIEVTLRNRDIGRGVTLHWHGYDVPNSQDGVPGVTQEAVLPGQEFVYRFRADQAGTYWYHTHSASDIGVRKGLYGVLVVRAGPVAGVDIAVPVHTLAGRLVPVPATSVKPGTSVRLRLINTDSDPHRYALSGAPFRVVAIDGVDLRGPASLVDTAVGIAAGGRYDLAFTGPAVLQVDGRTVWGTGEAATDSWPVLDPLRYGEAAPVPWSRFDRSFTLVLDRGLDLRGLLPRYAHTVNGAADPDIPVQVVRSGEIVKFTVVNRSLVVHPWHLHGHHVLVLSRDGRAASGTPLWLDSFDVRPGEVWEVAFVADNPGMWANHCHNLPHAEAGMMMHLLVD